MCGYCTFLLGFCIGFVLLIEEKRNCFLLLHAVSCANMLTQKLNLVFTDFFGEVTGG